MSIYLNNKKVYPDALHSIEHIMTMGMLGRELGGMVLVE